MKQFVTRLYLSHLSSKYHPDRATTYLSLGLLGSELRALSTVGISGPSTWRTINRGPKCDLPMKACRLGPARCEEHSSSRRPWPDWEYLSSSTKIWVSTNRKHLWCSHQRELNPLIVSLHLWTEKYKGTPSTRDRQVHISAGVVIGLDTRARGPFSAWTPFNWIQISPGVISPEILWV